MVRTALLLSALSGIRIAGRQGAAAVVLAVVALIFPAGAARAERPNVLFIAVDDFRPQTRSYGREFMITPNMDRLAREGRLFRRHYVQAPACGPSRYAMLTGQYPKRPVSWTMSAFNLYQQRLAPQSLPESLRKHGYYTVQIGKVSHSPDGFLADQRRNAETGIDNTYDRAPHLHHTDPNAPEVPGAWNEHATPLGPWQTAWGGFFGYDGGKTRNRGKTPPFEAADVPDTGYADGLIADAAVKTLARLRERGEPFFLAVGFYKPHLPFTAPKKYWDLYDRDAIDFSDVVIPVRRRAGEFFSSYGHSPDRVNRDPAYVRQLHHAYYACTSYVDAQIGKVLDALDELKLSDNTIVVLWGDHGYHLGELGYWAKATLHEHSLRSALIVRVPGMPHPGRPTDAIVNAIDIYPTLLELAGLPMPEHLDGRSFAKALNDPGADPVGQAVSFYGNTISLRTDRHRLMRRRDEVRLYDHATDQGERNNVAERNPELVAELQRRLDEILDRRKAR